jgi:hypothetical protein
MFFDPENIGSKKRHSGNGLSRNRSSSGPEQEFQRAGTGVPAGRNRSSSEIAGISPYDGNGSIIYLSFDDYFLSMFWS